MKRILNVVVLTLAMNFVLVAGGAGWLASSGHLTKARLGEVRKVLFPPPVTQPTATTQPSMTAAPTDPVSRLGAMLAKAAGRDPGQRLEAVQQADDFQMAELDRRRREAADVLAQAELAQSKVTAEREAVLHDRQSLAAEQTQQSTAAADKGFQDTLQLYQTLPAKQVKSIFASLSDDTVQQYLQAMDPVQAKKIMKEFKTPAEIARLEAVMEKIRLAHVPAGPPLTPPVPTDANATAAVPEGR